MYFIYIKSINHKRNIRQGTVGIDGYRQIAEWKFSGIGHECSMKLIYLINILKQGHTQFFIDWLTKI